jgi:hypothetical protein
VEPERMLTNYTGEGKLKTKPFVLNFYIYLEDILA